MANNKGEKHMRQLVLFQTGNIEFALDRNCISRIGSIPEDSKETAGRIQQKSIEDEGRDVLLIDLAATLTPNTAPSYPSEAEMIVVKESPLALLADQVKSALDINGEHMEELPLIFGGTARACFPKVLQTENKMVLVIDPDALAHVEPYAAIIRAKPETQHQRTENKQESPHAQMPALPSQAPATPIAQDPLEAMVVEKLRKIIGRRVKEVVAQTMARALKQQLE